MKKSIAILVVAGLAASATAQSEGYEFKVDGALSPSNPSVNVTLAATFPAADYAFAGARLDVIASEAGWGTPELILMGPGTTAGTVAGASVEGIIVGQLNFPPGMIFADPSNPIDVWKSDFAPADVTTVRTIDLSTSTGQFAIYPERDSSVSETRTPTEGAGAIEVIPAPASLALLGLGGLAAARRRR